MHDGALTLMPGGARLFGYTGHGFRPTVLTPIQTLIAYFSAHLLALYDGTGGVSFSSGTNVNGWADARGPGFAPPLILGGGGVPPVFDPIAKSITITNTVGQILTTAAASALFDLSAPKAIVSIMSSLVAGFHNFAAIAESGAAARFLSTAEHNAGGYAARGGAGTITVDSGNAPDGTIRIVVASAGAGEVNIDTPSTPRVSGAAGAVAAGANFFSAGGYFAGDEATGQTMLTQMVLDEVPSPADLAAINAFGITRGAVLFP
jgi:hypothetical protein